MPSKKYRKRKYNKRRGERRVNQKKPIVEFTDEEQIKWLPHVIQLYQMHFCKLCDAGLKKNSKTMKDMDDLLKKDMDDLLKRIDRLATNWAKNELSHVQWDMVSPEMKETAKASFKRHYGFPLTQSEKIVLAIFMKNKIYNV